MRCKNCLASCRHHVNHFSRSKMFAQYFFCHFCWIFCRYKENRQRLFLHSSFPMLRRQEIWWWFIGHVPYQYKIDVVFSCSCSKGKTVFAIAQYRILSLYIAKDSLLCHNSSTLHFIAIFTLFAVIISMLHNFKTTLTGKVTVIRNNNMESEKKVTNNNQPRARSRGREHAREWERALGWDKRLLHIKLIGSGCMTTICSIFVVVTLKAFNNCQ